MVLLKVDVLLLAFLTNNDEVGLYAAAARLVEGTQFVAWAFNAAMLPWVALTTGAALARGYMLGLKLLAAGLIPVGAILACFAGPIVDLLYGDEFAGAALPLALLGCTVALYGLQSFSGTVLIGRDSPGILVRIAGAVVIQNIACNLVAIPLWGADGAAGVALSSSVLMATLTIWFGTRRTRAFSPVRAFGGPVLAGAALVAVALAAADAAGRDPRRARLRRGAGRGGVRPAPRRRAHVPARATAAVAPASRRRPGRVAASGTGRG